MARCDKREYGRAMTKKTGSNDGGLFDGLPDEFQMWMSHGDKLITIPEGFVDIGTTANSEHAAIGNTEARIWGLQFHPEVGLITHRHCARVQLTWPPCCEGDPLSSGQGYSGQLCQPPLQLRTDVENGEDSRQIHRESKLNDDFPPSGAT